MRPFGIWVAGCWLSSKFLLEAVGEALSLDGVGSAAGVDAGATFVLGVMDLSGLQPDLAVVRVTICAVVASRVEDTAEHRPQCYRLSRHLLGVLSFSTGGISSCIFTTIRL